MVRTILTALGASAASLSVPIVIGVWTYSNGAPDDLSDAPYRAAGTLLFLSPLVLGGGALWFWALGASLRRAGQIGLTPLLVASFIAGTVVGLLASYHEFVEGDFDAAATTFSVLGSGTFYCASVGACIFWLLNRKAQPACTV